MTDTEFRRLLTETTETVRSMLTAHYSDFRPRFEQLEKKLSKLEAQFSRPWWKRMLGK